MLVRLNRCMVLYELGDTLHAWSIRFADSRRGTFQMLGICWEGRLGDFLQAYNGALAWVFRRRGVIFLIWVFWGKQRTECSRPRAGSGSSTIPPAKTGRWLHSAEEPPAVEQLTNPGVGCTLREEPRVATSA